MICSECWTKLWEFHKFYSSVEKAKNNYFQKLEGTNFAEVKCEPIGGDADNQSSVKSEPIEEDVLKCESPTPRVNEIKNRCKIQNSSNDDIEVADSSNDDSNTEYDQCDEKFDGESGADLRRDEWTTPKPATEVMTISVATVNKNIVMRDKFDKLAPNYIDMVCERCKHPFTRLSEARKHYRLKHKQRNAWVKCCQKKMDLYDIIEHIQYHLNPEIFKWAQPCLASMLSCIMIIYLRTLSDAMNAVCSFSGVGTWRDIVQAISPSNSNAMFARKHSLLCTFSSNTFWSCTQASSDNTNVTFARNNVHSSIFYIITFQKNIRIICCRTNVKCVKKGKFKISCSKKKQ